MIMNRQKGAGSRKELMRVFSLKQLIESRLIRIDTGDPKKSLSFEYDDQIPEALFGNEKALGELLTLLTIYAWERLEEGKLDIVVQGFDETDDTIKAQFSFCECRSRDELGDSPYQQRLFVNAEDDGSDCRLINETCARLGTEVIALSGPHGERFVSFIAQFRKIPSAKKRSRDDLRQGSIRGKRLLLVEDNEIYRMVLKSHFVQWGIEVTDVRDGEKAIELVDCEGPFDFGVFDDSLPGITGSDLAQYCRSRSRQNQMRIISLKGPDKTTTEGFFDECLSKPALPCALKSVLRRFAAGHS